MGKVLNVNVNNILVENIPPVYFVLLLVECICVCVYSLRMCIKYSEVG